MKAIVGAILMLAASVYALAFVTADTTWLNGKPVNPEFFAITGIIHFVLGLYFLFFATDTRS